MTFLEKMRNAARKNMTEKQEAEGVALPVETEEVSTEVEEAEVIPNDNEETVEAVEIQETQDENTAIPVITWKPEEGEQTLLVASQREATALYSAIIKTADENPEEMEWFGMDLQRTMLEDISEAQQKRLALSLQEVWDLSVALETEITARQQGAEGKRILVLIERGDFLAEVLADEENRNDPLFATVGSNINKIINEGASVNINVLMRIEAENVEAWKATGFIQTLTL